MSAIEHMVTAALSRLRVSIEANARYQSLQIAKGFAELRTPSYPIGIGGIGGGNPPPVYGCGGGGGAGGAYRFEVPNGTAAMFITCMGGGGGGAR